MYRKYNVLPHLFLQIALLVFSLGIHATSIAGPSVEETFLQGQRYLEQANIPQANVSLARLPSQSPYTKLLAGNIAAAQGNIDQAFLLLLPLQSNTQLINPAAASLHASLSSAYEKQGVYFNALDHLTQYETYLDDSQTIALNHANIWRLLTGLPTETLIELRGESTDTLTQGWIDLSLAAKQPNSNAGIGDWENSYADHPAAIFAKSLLKEKPANVSAIVPANDISTATLNEGVIALILPFDLEANKAKAEAFQLGLQSALSEKALTNEVKIYTSIGDKESFTDLYNLAQDEGATYIIGPMLNEEWDGTLKPKHNGIQTLTLLDSGLPSSVQTQHAGLSLKDEATSIANFASKNAIQRISILASDSPQAEAQTAAFETEWKNKSDIPLNVIKVGIDANFRTLLELKDTVANNSTEMLLLAMSAQEAIRIKPYLDASITTIGFSSINNLNDDKPVTLNAIRFVDIPFLTEKNNADFNIYREVSTSITHNGSLRWFALGVDTVSLLLAKSHLQETQVIRGLTGTMQVEPNGQIKRQLPLARFAYDGVIPDSH